MLAIRRDGLAPVEAYASFFRSARRRRILRRHVLPVPQDPISGVLVCVLCLVPAAFLTHDSAHPTAV